MYSKGAQQRIVPQPTWVRSWMEWYVSAGNVGTGFLVRKILMALISTKLSIFGKNTRPYISRARMELKASELVTSAKREAFWKRNLVGRPWRPPLVVRFAFSSDVSMWRAAAMVEGLGIGSRPLKGILLDTGKPTK